MSGDGRFGRPSGTCHSVPQAPSAEALGYFRTLLRSWPFRSEAAGTTYFGIAVNLELIA